MSSDHWQTQLDAAIDDVLDTLEAASRDGVKLDPVATIMQRMQARGEEINFDEAPLLLKMMLGQMMPGQ